MKPRATHIISFFLAVVWFTPLLFILIINIEEKLVHHRMMEKMEREHLREIIVPASAVTWMDDSEISVEGHMFDVNTFTFKDGYYTFNGLFDEDETRLMHQLDETTGKNKEDNGPLSQFFEWVPLPARNNENLNKLFCNNTAVFASLKLPSVKQLPRTVLTPPPDSPWASQTQ